MDFSTLEYSVENQGGFKLSEALRLWKTKYPEFIDFEKDVITTPHPALKALGEFVHEMWNSIEPVSVKEALAQPNNETRRVYFSCIGTQKLFAGLNPTLRDRQVINKKRYGWDDNNKEIIKEFEDVYELYEIDGKKMFEKNRWGGDPNPVYAVRCWCTTTNREYWLYVPTEAATGQRWVGSGYAVYDVIRAIAWTIQIDVANPERIYRQGDIIVAKMGSQSTVTEPYHLDKEQYLNLMYSES